MSWYSLLKYLHILAVAMMVGGVFARQMVRGVAKKTGDVKLVASLTQMAVRLDRAMVIPGSNAVLVVGVILALVMKAPIFGFLQGASQNWLLVSNILLVMILALVFGVFLPHNKKLEAMMQAALAQGHITPELSAALENRKQALAHRFEEIAMLAIAALMVLKPF